jgi:hypothetical protein
MPVSFLFFARFVLFIGFGIVSVIPVVVATALIPIPPPGIGAIVVPAAVVGPGIERPSHPEGIVPIERIVIIHVRVHFSVAIGAAPGALDPFFFNVRFLLLDLRMLQHGIAPGEEKGQDDQQGDHRYRSKSVSIHPEHLLSRDGVSKYFERLERSFVPRRFLEP